jgi:hypothetical protein
MCKVIPKFQLPESLGAKVEIGCPVSQFQLIKLIHRMAKQQNGRMAEHQNGRMTEWQNRRPKTTFDSSIGWG